MSHLSHGFTGLFHLMTHEGSRPLQPIAATALAERAKTPDGLGTAVLIATRAFTALIDSHTDMMTEDKAIIPTILLGALYQMAQDLKELGPDSPEFAAAAKEFAVTEAAVKTAIAHAS